MPLWIVLQDILVSPLELSVTKTHLVSLHGVLYPVVVEEVRLKPGLIPTHKGPVRTMNELKNAAKLIYTSSLHYNALVLEISVQPHYVHFNHLVNFWSLSLAMCSEDIN